MWWGVRTGYYKIREVNERSIAKNLPHHSMCDLLVAPHPHTQALTVGCL